MRGNQLTTIFPEHKEPLNQLPLIFIINKDGAFLKLKIWVEVVDPYLMILMELIG
jgi:hypothetical protein